jgi:hypothetical protein
VPRCEKIGDRPNSPSVNTRLSDSARAEDFEGGGQPSELIQWIFTILYLSNSKKVLPK